jgi:hypothetical protein
MLEAWAEGRSSLLGQDRARHSDLESAVAS